MRWVTFDSQTEIDCQCLMIFVTAGADGFISIDDIENNR